MIQKRFLRHASLVWVVATVSSVSAVPANAGSDPFLGEVEFLPYTFCPVNFAEANGQLLSINQNQALFSLYGTNYGGNGTTTFGLPAIRPPIPANGPSLKACIALTGVYPSRN